MAETSGLLLQSIVFGFCFVAGVLGYWIVTYKLKDPSKIYSTSVESPATTVKKGS
jgi:hypothetical protein